MDKKNNFMKVSECPHELKEVIFWVNVWLQTDESAQEIFSDNLTILLQDQAESSQSFDEIKMRLRSLLNENEIQKGFFKYLTSDNTFYMWDVIDKFHEVLRAYAVLVSISQVNESEIKQFGNKAFTENGMSLAAKKALFIEKLICFTSEPVFFDSTFRLNSDGLIKPDITGFASLFMKYDIPFARIRGCPICKEIYWAKRLDARTCGDPRCATNLSKKNIRKSEKLKGLLANLDKEKSKLQKLQSLGNGNGLVTEQKRKISELENQIDDLNK